MAAEDENMQEMTVGGAPPQYETKKPRSAVKTGLVATLMAGPLMGLGAGLIQRFRNKSYLEDAANQTARDKTEKERLLETLTKEKDLADPDEKRIVEYARGLVSDGYGRIAGGDKSGYEVIAHARTLLEGIMGKDIDARKQELKAQNDTQRDLVTTAAKAYRQEYQTTYDQVAGINHQTQKILDLVAQPDFDPNKPLNKAHLAELLSMGGLMFKDTPDMMDALTQGIGALNGIAGGVVGGIATALKAKEFKVTAEDYNKLALNAQKYAKIYAEQKMGQLGERSRSLDGFAKKLGVIPSDYSLSDYVTGKDEEVKMTPNPVFTGGFQNKDEPSRAPTNRVINPARYHGTTGNWGAPKRPTN